jgi:hypothetical protein
MRSLMTLFTLMLAMAADFGAMLVSDLVSSDQRIGWFLF